jgi:hypothetical protein
MPPAIYPEIFACLGMAVGMYGLLYLEVARVPSRGWLMAAVGLIGKILAHRRRRAYRPGTMAAQGVHPVPDQRSDLVDTVWLVPVGCLETVYCGCRRPPYKHLTGYFPIIILSLYRSGSVS